MFGEHIKNSMENCGYEKIAMRTDSQGVTFINSENAEVIISPTGVYNLRRLGKHVLGPTTSDADIINKLCMFKKLK